MPNIQGRNEGKCVSQIAIARYSSKYNNITSEFNWERVKNRGQKSSEKCVVSRLRMTHNKWRQLFQRLHDHESEDYHIHPKQINAIRWNPTVNG
eukprot:CCRYP_016866-RA/>CCRYP_016866-RA protein AED:0.32 eAED:0.63 QI:178/0/0.5/1/0/0/2/0/93